MEPPAERPGHPRMPSVRPRRAPPERAVRSMFDDVALRYDLLNTLLSAGLDRRWRQAAVREIAVDRGDRVLDVGCGTGKLGALLAARARLTGLDLSHEMLLRARAARPPLALVQGSAFALPFADRTFHGAVSGFLLRNLEDLPRAFSELARVLKPGARAALMDITEPRHPLFRRLFDMYFGIVAPALGATAGKRDAYRYLVRSLAQLPPPEEVGGLLQQAGFERCRTRPLSGGMVTLFAGTRSPS